MRDYNLATWEGGDPECDHVKGAYRGDEGERTWDGGPVHGGKKYYEDACPKCGAIRHDAGIGLEPALDCGRPHMELREDLTDEQYQFVLSRLKELGLV